MFLSPSFNSLWVSGTQSVQTSQAPLQGGSSRKAEISSPHRLCTEVGGGGWLESTSRLPLSLLFALSSLEKPRAFEQSVSRLPGLSAFMPKSLLQSFEILNLCPPRLQRLALLCACVPCSLKKVPTCSPSGCETRGSMSHFTGGACLSPRLAVQICVHLKGGGRPACSAGALFP